MPSPSHPTISFWDYWVDATQRSALFLDTLRQRGDNYAEHNSKVVPNVLDFGAELVSDGRGLPRPVNYGLARMAPPEGAEIVERKPPVVVVDPRAGHGPGIGGMKPESEIGEAMRAGHPCYFVGFRPTPEPGQTMDDVFLAEAAFVETVAERHGDATGKPIVIANCQAGWQTMIAAALKPDAFGPILLAGAPLSYWAGVHGKNPMRYLGGLMGGTWLTALSGDLGAGLFDGAHLVSNFESLNPANTWWTKPYNLYSKVDTEAPRFLDFETWWGSPVLLNAQEMQWIADNLFVGNKLARGEIQTSDGVRVDLRNIKSPIVVFCSKGDDITPPQQALGWILDVYRDVDDLIASNQTIIYALHESIGHLGIFVSGKVAAKEHREFVSCMEMIDVMPPGLYEAVLAPVDETTVRPDLVDGRYVLKLEARTFDDIRKLGGNDEADERRFATVARVSEINLGLYRTLMQPWVRALVNEPLAQAMRATHPHRVRFSALSSEAPGGAAIRLAAEWARAHRRPVADDYPILEGQKAFAQAMESGLKAFGEMRDTFSETVFLNLYGLPLLQASVGLKADPNGAIASPGRDLAREAAELRRRVALESRFEHGGVAEAVLRALIYVRLAVGAADERGYRLLKAAADAGGATDRASVKRFKTMAREQLQLVHLDPKRAIAALPKLVEPGSPEAHKTLTALDRLLAATGTDNEIAGDRVGEIRALLAVPAALTGAGE